MAFRAHIVVSDGTGTRLSAARLKTLRESESVILPGHNGTRSGVPGIWVETDPQYHERGEAKPLFVAKVRRLVQTLAADGLRTEIGCTNELSLDALAHLRQDGYKVVRR